MVMMIIITSCVIVIVVIIFIIIIIIAFFVFDDDDDDDDDDDADLVSQPSVAYIPTMVDTKCSDRHTYASFSKIGQFMSNGQTTSIYDACVKYKYVYIYIYT